MLSRNGNQVCRLYFHYAKDNNNWSWNSITQLRCIRVNKHTQLIVAGCNELIRDSLFEFEETLRNQIIPD